MNEIPVSVAVITYNHENYIRQALDGILMQKTSFPFEVVIGEDCSKDNTRKILLEYKAAHPDKIHLILPEHNLGVCKNFHDTICSCNGEYVAYCEGDDWWTNENKLQMQYEYMQLHPECGLCYTDIDIYFENEEFLDRNVFKKNAEQLPKTFEEHLINSGYLAPLTWFFKKDIFLKIDLNNHKDLTLVVALDFFLNSEVHFINENTGTYRVHPGSAAQQTDPKKHFEYLKDILSTQLEYAAKGKVGESVTNKIYSIDYASFIYSAVKADDKDFISEASIFYGRGEKSPAIEELAFLSRKLIDKEREFESICRSRAYRLGRATLKPLKVFKK